MSDCQGKCDCGWPGPDYGPHDPDCRSLDKCDGERGIWCEKHWQEKLHEHGWMSGLVGNCGGSTYVQTEDRMRQDMIDAGRGHLLPDVLADRIDMAHTVGNSMRPGIEPPSASRTGKAGEHT